MPEDQREAVATNSRIAESFLLARLAAESSAYHRGLALEYHPNRQSSFAFHKSNVINMIKNWDFGLTILGNFDSGVGVSVDVHRADIEVKLLASRLLANDWFLVYHNVKGCEHLRVELAAFIERLKSVSPATFAKNCNFSD